MSEDLQLHLQQKADDLGNTLEREALFFAELNSKVSARCIDLDGVAALSRQIVLEAQAAIHKAQVVYDAARTAQRPG